MKRAAVPSVFVCEVRKLKGLYVHIPFCLKKCKYCDFISFDGCPEKKAAYLDALLSDMLRYCGEAVDTVFIGGGTPTSLNAAELSRLLMMINENFALTDDCEFTVEANPKTLTAEKLEILKGGRVNRLSIGVQSFSDAELTAIGRVHTSREAEETVRLAKEYFDNVSLDLMSALPSQTIESFSETLKRAVALAPSHISCYSLILEEGTPLFEEYEKGLLNLPDEDTEREMYEQACRILEENGYSQYEISNFAKKGCSSRHNKRYWECSEYIGAGLAAHSYIDGVRFSNTDELSSYIKGDPTRYNQEKLTQNDKMSEFMFLGLRMTDGVSKAKFFEKFGIEIEKVFEKPLSKFIKMGMIKEENGKIRLSHEGISVSNSILCEFIM